MTDAQKKCVLCGRIWVIENSCCDPYVNHLTSSELDDALLKHEAACRRLQQEIKERDHMEYQIQKIIKLV
jgi:hypothetical protein